MAFLKSEKDLRHIEFWNLDKLEGRKKLKTSTWIKTYHPTRDGQLKMTQENNLKELEITRGRFNIYSALDCPFSKFFMDPASLRS